MRHFIVTSLLISGTLACSAAPEAPLETTAEDAICEDCTGAGGAGGAGSAPVCSSVCGSTADCAKECQTSPGNRTTCGALGFCRTCANFCSPEIACSNSCKLPDRSLTTCESYGSCKRYDTYCAYPVITSAAVTDIDENFVGGDKAYMYFASANGTKKHTFPSAIGGFAYDPASAWASNFRGPMKITGESERPQWEWFDNGPGGHSVDFGTRGTPYLYGKECRSVVTGSAVPLLTQKAEVVWEDDECFGPFCNGDDRVGSFTIDRGHCSADVWNRGHVSRWSELHGASVGGDVSRVSYKLWCYSCRNMPNTSCSAGVQ